MGNQILYYNGLFEPENRVMGHPVSISLLHHHPTWEPLPVLLLVPWMDLMKRIWFWNYVHWVVCESLYEAFHRDPHLMEGVMINKTNQIIIISYLSGPPCCTRHCILISSLP